MLAFFDPPTAAFNALALVASLVGCGLGAWALVIAYDQLRKTLTAARAAERAARQTQDRLTKVSSLVSVHRLTVFTGELLVCVRAADWGGATMRSKDLRAGLSALAANEGSNLIRSAKWSALMDAAARGQAQITTLAAGPTPDVALQRTCQATIQWLDAELHGLAGTAQKLEGD